MARHALVLVAFALAAAGCGVSLAAPEHTRGEAKASVDGYGLSVALPEGWNGRVYRLSAADSITLEAANAALPTEGEVLNADQLASGSAYIVVNDIGQPPPYLGRERSWQRDPSLPLAVTRTDVAGPYEGGFPAGANMSVVINNRPLMIRVRFDSQPTDADLEAVNDVLASLHVTAP
jgi:hypothetical protein